MSDDLVRVENLCVVAGGQPIVSDISFAIARGEVLALIGESGSGKTTIALALLGHARPGARIAGGTIEVAGQRIDQLDEPALRAVRGRTIAYVAQSAAAAFNPALTIMSQVIEPALIHRLMDCVAAEARAIDLFRRLALAEPERIGERYPHQVSGGQLQRLMAAMALITDPALVVFDEPTTALDPTTQVEVLRVFKQAVRDLDTTAVYVSHDLAVVAQIADRIVVLKEGTIRESGPTSAILSAPADDYTRRLVAAAAPRTPAEPAAAEPAPLLELSNITAGYAGVTVLDGIDLAIGRGQVLGIVGESGSGKSTLARVVAGLHAPVVGRVAFDGTLLAGTVRERSRDELRRVQIVFQSADTALNPAVSVGTAIGRPLTFYHGLRGASLRREVARLLDMVRLPATLADRRPGELSGGQRQRVSLARALAARPDLLLCDEVTAALDPVVAAAVLDLLVELRRELGLAYLFITHDLNLVRAIADEIAVLHKGRVIERIAPADLTTGARHPYTRRLVAAVPELRPGWLEEVTSG